MPEQVLAVQMRKDTGKGAARKLRQNKEIPAVFYGPGRDPIMLSVNYSELQRLLKEASGENIILDLEVTSDTGTESMTAMLKEIQMDPVKETFLHADFYEVSMDKKITVDVPIQLVNTPVGVTKGGVLQPIRRELTISCLPGKLTDTLDIDVSDLDIGDSLHVRDIKLPEGIVPVDEGHLTVAIVSAPAVSAEKEAEEEMETETEEEGEVTEQGAEES